MTAASRPGLRGVAPPGTAAVYADFDDGAGGGTLTARYAGGGLVELAITGPCVLLRISELDAVSARILAVACGADPGEAG